MQIHDDFMTQENREFITEVVQDKYENIVNKSTITNTIEWTPNMRRTGVIAKKIGVLPLWLKNGEKITTTLLQVW